ncbi:MAG: SPASM domain-containing protein [Candidatus Aminicenantes bacterium]|nr:SPASM domain-containing protein [Candidatus Aminicenantes bacterium]
MFSEINYYNRLFRIWRNFRRRRIHATAMPFRLWVELHGGCNLRCSFCPNKDLDESLKGPMEWDVFRKVIDEARGFVFDLTLNHRGESLLHPDAVEMIRYAAERIRFTKLHTNGVLLNEAVSTELVKSGLKRLSFSFDGFVKEDYEKNRVGADFDQVVGNIRNLLQIRRDRGSRTPRVAIEVIEFNESQMAREKQERFIREFKALGLDELVVKKPHNWAGYLKTGYRRRRYAPCTFLWSSMLILWNGDVSPCSQDFFARYLVGNVRDKSMREIWNDEPMRRLRKGLREERYREFPACAECDRLWRDTFLGIPREYLKQILTHRMP